METFRKNQTERQKKVCYDFMRFRDSCSTNNFLNDSTQNSLEPTQILFKRPQFARLQDSTSPVITDLSIALARNIWTWKLLVLQQYVVGVTSRITSTRERNLAGDIFKKLMITIFQTRLLKKQFSLQRKNQTNVLKTEKFP